MSFCLSSSKVVVLNIDVLIIHFLQRDEKKSAASITCEGVRFGIEIERARLAKRATVANRNYSKSQPEYNDSRPAQAGPYVVLVLVLVVVVGVVVFFFFVRGRSKSSYDLPPFCV